MAQSEHDASKRIFHSPWETSARPHPQSVRPRPLEVSTPPRKPEVSIPPRRVPSLYPTSPPTTQKPNPHGGVQRDKPVAHSLRPKPTPITIDSLKEQRHSQALVKEELVEQTLYDLFEVEPTVSEDELRRAYKRVWACFHPDHYASYGLYSRAQLEAQLNQFQTAFELLMDPEQRHQYNQKAFPDGIPTTQNSTLEVASRVTPTFQALVPHREARAHWNSSIPPDQLGAALKALRQHFNLPLSVLHERSKISISMLELIEADDFMNMPAEVYLRGFIKELLHIFGVNALVDLDSYLKAYQIARARA